MKTGFSTNAFTEKSLSYCIESISNIGYDGVELVLDVPHAFLPLNRKCLSTIKNCLKKNKIKVANLNVNTVVGWYDKNTMIEKFEPSLSNKNEKLRQWRLNYTKQAIELASILESTSICITSGISPKSEKSIHLRNFKKSLTELASFAETKNISIAIEYEPGLLIENSHDVYSIVSQFNNIGLNLDVCHAAVLGEDVSKIIKKFRKKILHTHISDCKNNIHYHLIPGLGSIDFPAMYKSLKEINYEGFLTAELYTYSKNPEYAAKITFTYLKNLMLNHVC
ncbi:MAG: sugar phosphate isomerase/epimerase [Nitrosarchaeum sp.]|nr:sugar phosphate isomerase/epimerase [Nitrosarchaeum sp.]